MLKPWLEVNTAVSGRWKLILSNQLGANLSQCDCWDVFACQTLQNRRLSRIVETQQQGSHLLRFKRLQFSEEFDWKAIHHLYNIFRPEDVQQSHHWVKREAQKAKKILWNFRRIVRNRQKSRTFCEIYKVKRDRLFFPQVTIVSDYINQGEGRYPPPSTLPFLQCHLLQKTKAFTKLTTTIINHLICIKPCIS